jgi:hypothetical protein
MYGYVQRHIRYVLISAELLRERIREAAATVEPHRAWLKNCASFLHFSLICFKRVKLV